MKHILSKAGVLLGILFSLNALAVPKAGTPDFEFGVTPAMTVSGFNIGGSANDQARALVKGPGDRLYLIGPVILNGSSSGIGITRLFPEGTVDTTFGNNGKVVYKQVAFNYMDVNDAAVQADGKIVVAGSRRMIQPPNERMMVCRFESSGAIDAGFGDPATAGCRTIPSSLGNQVKANAVTIQLDGRIVVAGSALDSAKNTIRSVVARLRDTGEMDPSFGNQGQQHPGLRVTPPGVTDASMWFSDIDQGPDGGLVAVGAYDSLADGIEIDVLVAKLRQSDGTLDVDFGLHVVGFNKGGSNNDEAFAVQVLGDNSVLIAGTAQFGNAPKTVPVTLKYDSTGAPYPGFGVQGKYSYDTCVDACVMLTRDLQVADDGRFAIAGTKRVGNYASSNFFAMQFLPNGIRDGDFGPLDGVDDGLAHVDFFGDADAAARVLYQGARVLISGHARNQGTDDFAITRLTHGIPDMFTVGSAGGPGGTLSPNEQQVVSHSDQVHFVATPDPDFSLVQITGCGGSLFEGMYTTAPVTGDCVVTAEFTQDLVLNYAAGPHGFIEGLTPQVVPSGLSALPIKAIADKGFHFVQWSDGVLANPRQDTNVTQDVDVAAIIEINQYKVEPVAGPNGSVSPADMQLVPHGGNLQLTVQPAPGFAIGDITGCGGSLQGNLYTTTTIMQSCKVNVSFVPSNVMFSLHYLDGEHGVVLGEVQQSVVSGGDGAPVEAEADTGFHFVTWSDGATENPRQDTHVVADVEVTAVFAPSQSFTVTTSASAGGSISPELVQNVAPGDQIVFTLTPYNGFAIQNVTGTCGGSLVDDTYMTDEVNANCTVIAHFVAVEEPNVDPIGPIFSDGFED